MIAIPRVIGLGEFPSADPCRIDELLYGNRKVVEPHEPRSNDEPEWIAPLGTKMVIELEAAQVYGELLLVELEEFRRVVAVHRDVFE